MDFFEKNISSLNKRYNYIIDKIRKENTKKQTDEYGIENKADGNIVLYKNYNNRRWNLNSKWNSQAAAEIYAERYKIQLYGVYFVFGFSDGKFIRELRKKCDDTNLLVVYVPKPKLRALQQQDISILKSARKKTQPAAKMVIQEIHIALIVRKQFHMVRPSKKPVTILGMTEK